MRTPNKRVAKGYDIVVWVDDDGDIVAKAFTEPGHRSLKVFVSDYRNGDIVEIYCDPNQFIKEIEQDISIGTMNSEGIIVPMGRMHLH